MSKEDITYIAKENNLFDDKVSFDSLFEIKEVSAFFNQVIVRYEVTNVKLLKDFGKFKKGTQFQHIDMIVDLELYPRVSLNCFIRSKELMTNDDPLFLNYPDLKLKFTYSGQLYVGHEYRTKTDEEIREEGELCRKAALE